MSGRSSGRDLEARDLEALLPPGKLPPEEALPSEEALPRTEALHPATGGDTPASDPAAWLALFDEEEARVSAALSAVAAPIIDLARGMARALRQGGRIISFGAGTSGRLAALDAAEWGPTFGIAPERVLARIAGGEGALTRAVEGAEDELEPAREAVERLAIDARDLAIGISASGGAAYVRAALEAAAARGAAVAWITASPPPALEGGAAPLRVTLDLGPELIAGSTRLQAATATHRVLQRASVLCAIESGWIHRGRMVEMRPTNEKLRGRAVRIVSELAAVDAEHARASLAAADDDIKVALLHAALGLSIDAARQRLTEVDRHLSRIEGLPR